MTQLGKKKNHKITKKTVWVLCHDDANSPLWCLHRVKVTANHRHNGQKYIICRIFKQNNFPLLFYNACNYFLLNLLMRNNCSKERSVNCKNENLVNFKLTAYIQHLRCLELIFFLQICIICWHTCSFGSQQSCLLTN